MKTCSRCRKVSISETFGEPAWCPDCARRVTEEWHRRYPPVALQLQADAREDAKAKFHNLTQEAVRAVTRHNLTKGNPDLGWH